MRQSHRHEVHCICSALVTQGPPELPVQKKPRTNPRCASKHGAMSSTCCMNSVSCTRKRNQGYQLEDASAHAHTSLNHTTGAARKSNLNKSIPHQLTRHARRLHVTQIAPDRSAALKLRSPALCRELADVCEGLLLLLPLDPSHASLAVCSLQVQGPGHAAALVAARRRCVGFPWRSHHIRAPLRARGHTCPARRLLRLLQTASLRFRG